MLIFMTGLGPGVVWAGGNAGGGWRMAPLLVLLPVLLSSGLLSLPLHAIGVLVRAPLLASLTFTSSP